MKSLHTTPGPRPRLRAARAVFATDLIALIALIAPIALIALVAAAALGCAEDSAEGPSPDDISALALPSGKADSAYSPCALDGVLLLANDPALDAEVLTKLGLHSRAAKNIVKARDGVDGLPATQDDTPFATLEAIDAVPYVGPVALEQLVAAVEPSCPEGGRFVDVIMSPQLYDASHLARAAELIDGAQRSIDIAMYSYRDSAIGSALARAVDRGVKVRFIFESANEDRKSPAGSASAKLEDMGVDVRYVNKIMHHKFMIVDGPQTSALEALGSTLLTGSANWSSSAGTRYDENTTELRGVPELAMRYQREFNHIWASSRDFEFNDAIEPHVTMAIADWMLVDDTTVDAAFTSANFDVYDSSRFGATFTVVAGRNAVSDRIVELIDASQKSIRMASGHLRSRPVSEALLRKRVERPEMDIRIYLDGQEYISETSQRLQEDELDACFAAATTPAQEQKCLDSGYYFSYEMQRAGIELRFKHYAYRWHYSYAPQMHHKYIVIDDEIVVAGSYNLSDNAEHNTLENIAIYRYAGFPTVIEAFIANFESMWVTSVTEGLYDTLLDQVVNGSGKVPIVYDAMALTWEQVTVLKRAIRDACVDIDSTDWRTRPEAHYTCNRP